ncbi:MAG: glycosyltransferase [Candidatus Marinimicrobia bacterium]|nr:glycosyltransferase [Candidatus Neomarinimicrobiota bacterium]
MLTNNMGDPLVSVVMNCYNGERYLREAIQSVIDQTYTNWEIIIVDNKSTDESSVIISSFNDPRIKYSLSDQHVTLGVARNLALERVNGDYICFLDVDDVWYPDKILEQLAIFELNDVGLVYSLADRIDAEGLHIDFKQNYHSSPHERIAFIDILTNYNIVMSTVMISKPVLSDEKDRFDILLKHAEDYDLFARVLRKYSGIRINKIHVSYRLHEDQSTRNNYALSALEMNYILLKLTLIDKKLFEKHKWELRNFYGKLAFQEFINYVVYMDSPKTARQKLLPFIFTSFKYFALFVLSFFSPKLIKGLWNYTRRKSSKVNPIG